MVPYVIMNETSDNTDILSEIDEIHCLLMHRMIEKEIEEKKYKENENRNEFIIEREEAYNGLLLTQNKNRFGMSKKSGICSRYISDISKFGFGSNHPYLYLIPVFECLKQEILQRNTSAMITDQQWEDTLFQAMQILRDGLLNSWLARKYSEGYNIIRNDIIGVNHILVLLFYCDFSGLCTEFRSTYRLMTEMGDTTEMDVLQRHLNFYYFGRFLFECIEFYGKVLPNNKIVYHGLSRELLFDKFFTHFNQPLSTSTEFSVGFNFAGNEGIVLRLSNGRLSNEMNPFEDGQTRFINAELISHYSNEREYLFYGESALFTVESIYANGDWLPNIPLFNAFQQLITNQNVNWMLMFAKSKIKNKNKVVHKIAKKFKKIVKMELELNAMFASKYDKHLMNEQKVEVIDDEKKETHLNSEEFLECCEYILSKGEMLQYEKAEEQLLVILHEIKNQELDERKFSFINSYQHFSLGFESNDNISKTLLREVYKVIKKAMIEKKSNHEKERLKDSIEMLNISYEEKLFHYLCAVQNTWICVRNIYGIPLEIRQTFLVNEQQSNHIWFQRISSLLPNAKHFIFSEIAEERIINDCEMYCVSMLNFLMKKKKRYKISLELIEVESMHVVKGQFNMHIKQTVLKWEKQFWDAGLECSIQYLFELSAKHCIRFHLQ